MRWLITYVYACISYLDNIIQVISVLENNLEVTLQFGPEVKKLLQLAIIILNSSLENKTHKKNDFIVILSRILISML